MAKGLILGRLPNASTPSRFKAAAALFNPRVGSKDACQRFLRAMRGRKAKGPLVTLPNAVHTAIFAPTGVGKGVSCVIPFLLTCDESCVVVDFKGELAQITAKARQKMGHRVVLLDPFNAVTKTPDSFNPLDFIDGNSPLCIDDCFDLAGALVVRTGQDKGDGVHFLDVAEIFIAAMTLTVVLFAPKEARSLQSVADLLANSQKMEVAIKSLCESDAFDGIVSRIGHQLTHPKEKELGSVLSTANRFMRFLSTPAIAQSTRGTSSFNPAELTKGKGKMDVYLTLTPDRMRTQSGQLRMWVGAMLRAVVKGGLQEKNKVHFVLDEAASLGHMESLGDALAIGRGYGARLQFYYQDCGQLLKCWPEGQDQTLLSNTTQVFFGVNDQKTAEYVSARLGEETIIVEGGGTGTGTSRQITHGSQYSESVGRSSNHNDSWQQQARKLLKPEEVVALPPRGAITFTPGVPPVYTTLVRYYEEPRLFRPRSRWRAALAAVRTLWSSAFLFIVSALCALMVTVAAVETNTVQKPVSRPAERKVQDVPGNPQIHRGDQAGAAGAGAEADGRHGGAQGGGQGGGGGLRPRPDDGEPLERR